MNIEIQANGTTALKDVRQFVESRANVALKVLRDQISHVSVFLDYAAHSDKGARCLVLIRLGTHPDVEIEINDANLFNAIQLAMDEAGWTLADILMRQQSSLIQRQFEIIDALALPPKPAALVASERAA